MDMSDLKTKIEEIVEKIKADASFGEKFKKDPIQTVSGLLGIDIPADAVEKIVAGVKAKLAGDQLGGALDKLKGLF